MDDVTQEVSDAVSRIDFNVDTDSHIIHEPIFQLGLAVAKMHDETKLRVSSTEIDSDDGVPKFRIEGSVIDTHNKTLDNDD